MARSQSRLPHRRIFLVEDHPLVRQALHRVIEAERDLSVCGEAGDCEEALAAVLALQPDLVIVDLLLKTSNGMELIKALRKRAPAIPTMVLSMCEESIYAERAIRAGAQGYLSKREAVTEIIRAVRHVLGGGIYWSRRAAAQVVARIRPEA